MVPFAKMHGLGNDFVVLDFRREQVALAPALVRALADRHRGIGFDQLIVLRDSRRADVNMQIYNADGSESGACGNASRCIARELMVEIGRKRASLETLAGVLEARSAGNGLVTMDLGEVHSGWAEIPLSEERDTLHLRVAEADGLGEGVAVNVGNPHVVFLVDDPDSVDLARLGPRIEHAPLFPERANVSVAQVAGPGRIRLRVWERGVGITAACGTAACAAVVAAARHGLAERSAVVELDGGQLGVEWNAHDHALLTGPAVTVYRGTFDPAAMVAAA